LQAVVSLGDFGEAAAEKLGWVTLLRIVWSLEDIGKAAAEKGFEPATGKAAESLAKLTILSEKIVKTAIQDYESELKEKERDALQKFMRIYEQELEKLRAEKRTQNEKT
jgi:Skp family chaperone for outer membrane proteins